MNIFLWITAFVLSVIVVSFVWRLYSNRHTIPCPAWLGWLVEINNPFFKNSSAKSVISYLDIHPSMRVLDFGCGSGRLTIPLAQKVGEQGLVTAFDIQFAMLEKVRAKAKKAHVENIEYINGAAGENKLGVKKYDRALLVTVLGEIVDKNSLLQEIYTALRDDGILSITEIIADPHFMGYKSVSALANNAGFVKKDFFGNKISFTATFTKDLQ
ncbi:MAG: class I SAM-dependent methyltransferase [Campylobacterales bacterium]|nr:class I SAM-dependent methyltransferase [Campylobacterales bacterium]